MTKLRSLLARSQAALALALATSAYANDWESSISISDQENQNPSFNLDLRYFFTPLNHGGSTPWDEVAFVERISSAGAGIGYFKESFDIDVQGFAGPMMQLEVDSKTESLDAEIILRNPDSPHVFSASIDYDKLTSDRVSVVYPWTGGSPGNIPGWLVVGPGDPGPEYTVTETSFDYYTATVRYDYYLDRLWTIGSGLSYSDNSDTVTLHFGSDRLWDFGNGRWFGLEAGGLISRREYDVGYWHNGQLRRETNSMEAWGAQLAGRYYFNVKTLLDAGVAFHDAGDQYIYSLGFSRYLNDTLFIRLSANHVDITTFDADTTLLKLTFGGRY